MHNRAVFLRSIQSSTELLEFPPRHTPSCTDVRDLIAHTDAYNLGERQAEWLLKTPDDASGMALERKSTDVEVKESTPDQLGCLSISELSLVFNKVPHAEHIK